MTVEIKPVTSGKSLFGSPIMRQAIYPGVVSQRQR
jgi:hypothetical protein